MSKRLKILLVSTNPWLKKIEIILNKMNHETQHLHFDAKGLNSTDLDHLEFSLRTSRPDFCLIQNFFGLDDDIHYDMAALASIERHQIPLACWFTDSPRFTGSLNLQGRWHEGLSPAQSLIFYSDLSDRNFFDSKNMKASFLPLATSGAGPIAHQQSQYPLSFVDMREAQNSLYILENDTQLPTATSASILKTYELGFLSEFFATMRNPPFEVSPDLAAKELVRMAAPISSFLEGCPQNTKEMSALKMELHSQLKNELSHDFYYALELLEGRLDYYFARYHLSQVLAQTLPDSGSLFGGYEWIKILGSSLKQCSLPDSDEQMKAIFASSDINLSHSGFHPTRSARERPFEILAQGGFLVADQNDTLSQCFTSDEIAFYRTSFQAKERIEYFKSRPIERMKMIEKSHQRLVNEHTYQHRVQTLVSRAVEEWNL